MLESGCIVDVLEICDFGGTKGDEILGEVSEEKTHEGLGREGEMADAWMGGEYLSSTSCSSSNDADGIDDQLEGCGIAEMDEGVGMGERDVTLPEELCERDRR